MIPFWARRALPIAWRAMLAAGAGGALAVVAAGPDWAPAQAAPSSGAANPSVTEVPAAAAPRPSYRSITERPLFHSNRQPWKPPPAVVSLPPPPALAAAPAALQPPRGYTLVGVVLSGDTRSALLRPPGGTRTISLAAGQVLDGWVLREVGRESLRFEASGAVFQLAFPGPKRLDRSGRAFASP